MIKHTHSIGDETQVWHEGSLGSCPETIWDEVETVDGKPARLARGMSVQMPPEGPNRNRRIRDVTEID